MSNATSLDNQTFLSWLVDSFINFFQLQNFISQTIRYKEGQRAGGGGVRGLGSRGDSLLEGATCRCQLTFVQYVFPKKN